MTDTDDKEGFKVADINLITGVCAPTLTSLPTGAQKHLGNKPRFDLIPPEAMLALAEVYTLGAAKYSDRNWEKGIPYSVCLGSLKRHINEFELGNMINTDDGSLEHVVHAMWWAVALVTYIRRNRTDLNDLPPYANKSDLPPSDNKE